MLALGDISSIVWPRQAFQEACQTLIISTLIYSLFYFLVEWEDFLQKI